MSGRTEEFRTLREALITASENLRSQGKDQKILMNPEDCQLLLSDSVDESLYDSSMFKFYTDLCSCLNEDEKRPGIQMIELLRDLFHSSTTENYVRVLSTMPDYCSIQTIIGIMELYVFGIVSYIEETIKAIKEVQNNLIDIGKSKNLILDCKSIRDLLEDYNINKICLQFYIYIIENNPDVKDLDQIEKKMKEMMLRKFTRFEKARIVGARALQISYGAPVLMDYSDDILDPIDIALMEYENGWVPITVKEDGVREY